MQLSYAVSAGMLPALASNKRIKPMNKCEVKLNKIKLMANKMLPPRIKISGEIFFEKVAISIVANKDPNPLAAYI